MKLTPAQQRAWDELAEFARELGRSTRQAPYPDQRDDFEKDQEEERQFGWSIR